MSMNGISRETFCEMDTDSKLGVLFDYQQEAIKRVSELEDKFDRRKKFDTAVSSFMGLVGGVLAVLGSRIFKF
jgi:hypothetical protein